MVNQLHMSPLTSATAKYLAFQFFVSILAVVRTVSRLFRIFPSNGQAISQFSFECFFSFFGKYANFVISARNSQ